MRNWNNDEAFCITLELPNFESTYEELKHCQINYFSFNIIIFWVYLWGIETSIWFTCLTQAAPFWVYLWGIETPVIKSQRADSNHILSLPMRNWNSVIVCHLQPKDLILSLPMRNWNLIKILGIKLIIMNFESTYEELKLSHPGPPWPKAMILSLPMRNWNQPDQHKRGIRHVILSLPMRNWNPDTVPPHILFPLILSLPMRNWNTYEHQMIH